MLANFPGGLNSGGQYLKKKWNFFLVVTSFIIKRDFRHFHVIVVQWLQRNVQKGVVRANLLFCWSKLNFAVFVAVAIVVGWTPGLIMSGLVASQRKTRDRGNNADFSSNIVDCIMFSLLFPGFGVQNLWNTSYIQSRPHGRVNSSRKTSLDSARTKTGCGSRYAVEVSFSNKICSVC